MREYLINLDKGKYTPKKSVLTIQQITNQTSERKSDRNITFANNSPSHKTSMSHRKSISDKSIAYRSDRSKTVLEEPLKEI